MAWFKKPEDPWDIEPGKRRKEQRRKPMENPMDTVRAWNEKRKADAAVRQAELEALPKERCPWCGQEMERGYLIGGKSISWYPGFLTARAAWIGPGREDRKRQLRVDAEGDFIAYQTAWICHDCRKMVLDTSNMRNSDGYSFWDSDPEEGGAPGEAPENQGGGEETT